MKARFLLLLASGFIIAHQAQAQTPKRLDQVQLYNGSVIYGWVEESYGDHMVSIDVSPQTQLSLPQSEIKRIRYNRPNPEYLYQQKNGYFNRFELGILLGRTFEFDVTQASFTFQTVHGYQFMPSIGLGLGLGFDQYASSQHLPIYASLSGDLIQGRVSPYYFVNAGFSQAWDRGDDNFRTVKNAEGGFMFQTGLGIRTSFLGKGILLSVSYKKQESTLHFEDDIWRINANEKRTNRRVSITTGITF